MDVKVSRRDRRYLPEGVQEVLTSNVCDFYPVFDTKDQNLIMDIEMLSNDRDELLDRALFAVMKQRGSDPIEPNDGIQWAEAITGDVSAISIIQQVSRAVMEEGPGVKVTTETIKNGAKENVLFNVSLTNLL